MEGGQSRGISDRRHWALFDLSPRALKIDLAGGLVHAAQLGQLKRKRSECAFADLKLILTSRFDAWYCTGSQCGWPLTNGLLVEVILRRALLQCSSMRFPYGKLQGVGASDCIPIQVSHALTDEGTDRQPPIGAI
jgi:hypothetical protein